MKVDVIISGGGLVGSVLALGLSRNTINTVIIDQKSLISLENLEDGRTTSVSYGSQQIFEKLGIWEDLKPYAQPINTIRVFEKDSAWTVDYHSHYIHNSPMGYIIENRFLQYYLQENIKKHPLIAYEYSTKIEQVERLTHKVIVSLNNNRIYEAPLLVSAEGRHSVLRQSSSISSKQWDYKQTALVVHFYHNKHHEDTAWEVFTPSGPLAVLPMLPCKETGKNCSGLVWIKPFSFDWDLLNNQDLEQEIMRFFPFYGKIDVIGPRWTYPLSALNVHSYSDHRLALIGDAAHVIHPLAGQGANLGWRDADNLGKEIHEAYKVGLDIGSYSVLEVYNKKRCIDQQSVLWTTHLLNRLFSNESAVLHAARNLGLATVNHLSPLKKFLMKKAMGIEIN